MILLAVEGRLAGCPLGDRNSVVSSNPDMIDKR